MKMENRLTEETISDTLPFLMIWKATGGLSAIRGIRRQELLRPPAPREATLRQPHLTVTPTESGEARCLLTGQGLTQRPLRSVDAAGRWSK